MTCNQQNYLSLVGGANCNKTRGASCKVYPKTLPVLTRPTVSEIVTRLFELDLLSNERQFGNFSYLH